MLYPSTLLRVHEGSMCHIYWFFDLFLPGFFAFLFSFKCFLNGEAKNPGGMDQGLGEREEGIRNLCKVLPRFYQWILSEIKLLSLEQQ